MSLFYLSSVSVTAESLQVGAPNPTALKAVARCMENASNRLKHQHRFEESLQYGADMGGIPAQKEIASFLQREYQQPVDEKDIVVTCGASAGLQLLLTHFFSNQHTMFVEDPSYLLVPAFLKKGMFVKGDAVPLEDDGMNLDILEEKVKSLPVIPLSEQHPFRAAVYVIPVHHNPTGICYSAEKSRRLVELARKYDLLVISDDIYNILNYVEKPGQPGTFLPPPQRLFAYDSKTDAGYKGNVVANGTFSKIVAPGLRVGWFEAPKRVIARLKTDYVILSGGGMSYYVSHTLAEALRSGDIDNHIRGLKVAHKERISRFVGGVRERLGKYGVSINHPNGGYFLWVTLPDHITGEEVLEQAKTTENMTFVPGRRASLHDNFANRIRLSIAYYEADELEQAAERFSRAVEAVVVRKQQVQQ